MFQFHANFNSPSHSHTAPYIFGRINYFNNWQHKFQGDNVQEFSNLNADTLTGPGDTS